MDTDFAPASGPPAQPPQPEELPRPARRRHGGRFWLGQGARAAVGLRASLPADPLTAPWVPLLLVALQWALAIGVERAMVPGPAQFHPPALLLGWLGIAALAWVAHALRPSAANAPTAVQVFNLLTAQALWVQLGWGAVAVVVVQTGASARLGPSGWWALLLASWGSLAALQALRRLEQHDLEEVASTRLLIFTARMIRSGMTPRQACLACLAEPLSDDPQTVAALMDVVDVHFG